MTVGNLDRRIQIQKPSTSREADGSLVNSWTTFKTVWAKRKDGRASKRSESFAGEQFNDSLLTEWTIRYLAGIDGTERIIADDGVAGNLVGLPQMIGRREYLVLLVEEGLAK